MAVGRLSGLGFVCGILPIAVVHACLAISLAEGHVPVCNPYVDGCTSISATGRNGTAWFVFKAGMLPAAALMAIFFVRCARLLEARGIDRTKKLGWLPGVGVAAGAALALYTVFLGVDGEILRLLRRSGAVLYFGLSALAQFLLLAIIWETRSSTHGLPTWLKPSLLAAAGLLLVVGLGSIPVKQFLVDPDALENAIEWNYAFIMMAPYLLVAVALRSADRTAAESL